MALHGNSPDGIEGVASFMKKRAVDFKGTIPRDQAVRQWWNPVDVTQPPAKEGEARQRL